MTPNKSPSYLHDGSHLLLTGVTGSNTNYGGKTAIANWWFDNWGKRAFDLVIFGNFKGDKPPEKFADTVVHTVYGLAEAYNDGHRYICLTPTNDDWKGVHSRLKSFIQSVPKGVKKAVIHDEAPEYDTDSLRWFVRVAGNGCNCKSIVIAQAPGDLSMAVRKQTILGWVGPVTENNKHVFVTNNRAAHYVYMQANHEPYMWTFMTGPDKADRDTFQPVDSKYA